MAWGSSKASWTDADTALWHTCRVLEACAAGPDALEAVATVFPLPDGVVAVADGSFRADEYRADGDGSYDRGAVVAVGRTMFVAGMLAANAASNASARRRARADAEPRWRAAFDGTLAVTTHGFVLHTVTGVHHWNWDSVDLMQLDGRSQVIIQGQSSSGAISWRLHTWWAELLFHFWASVCHPDHPQFVSSAWLPDGWAEHARSHGHAPALGWASGLAAQEERGINPKADGPAPGSSDGSG